MSVLSRAVWLTAAVALGLGATASNRLDWLGPPDQVAPGVDLYRTTDRALVNGAGPIAVTLLRLDPFRVRLMTVLAQSGETDGVDTLEQIARAHGALAAVNGGLYSDRNHGPVGILKVAGELVGASTTPEGVALISAPVHGQTIVKFDQAAVRHVVSFRAGDRTHTVLIDGIDTTRARGRLMLYTPMYHADTDTAPTGTEWQLDGHPLKVVGIRVRQGRTPIPRSGAVLSYGGTDLPADLAALAVGVPVTIRDSWTSEWGVSGGELDHAESIVGGAGLLHANGQAVTNWPAVEKVDPTFVNARHPRTVIGVDGHGMVWLAVIDGRSALYSVGMSFAELEGLCNRLDLTGALNLDGGSSTCMVVRGRVVNRPAADRQGINNALVVVAR